MLFSYPPFSIEIRKSTEVCIISVSLFALSSCDHFMCDEKTQETTSAVKQKLRGLPEAPDYKQLIAKVNWSIYVFYLVEVAGLRNCTTK